MDEVLPILFGLLPDKTQQTYPTFVVEAQCLRPDLRHDTIMTGYELATLNAAATVFRL